MVCDMLLKLVAVVVLFVDGLRADTNFLTGANDIIVVRDEVKLNYSRITS